MIASHEVSASERVVLVLEEVLSLEQQLAAACEMLGPAVSTHAAASDFLQTLRAHAEANVAAFSSRLDELSTGAGDADACYQSRGPVARSTKLEATHPVSSAIREVAKIAQDLIVTSAILLHTAVRNRDSWIAATDGTTAHLARRNVQTYQMLLARLSSLIGASVLWDLEADGLHCACTCPACSLGCCVCGQAVVWREAHLAAGSAMAPEHITIPPPRPASPAATAGFLAGDAILEVDGVVADSIAALMTSFKHVDAGATTRVLIRRDNRELHLRLVKPNAHAALPPLSQEGGDCLQPSGQEFYLDRARDLQRQLRRGGAPITPHPDGIGALTPRELQVLRLVADGATNPMIAAKLRIARPTVARHIGSILAKLGAGNRAEAASLAVAHGLQRDGAVPVANGRTGR